MRVVVCLPADRFQRGHAGAHREHRDRLGPDKRVARQALAHPRCSRARRPARTPRILRKALTGVSRSAMTSRKIGTARMSSLRRAIAATSSSEGRVDQRSDRPRDVGIGLHCLNHRYLLTAANLAKRKKTPAPEGTEASNDAPRYHPRWIRLGPGSHSAARRALPPRIARLPVTGELPAPPTESYDCSGRDSRTHSAPQGLRACTIPGSLRPRLAAPTRSDHVDTLFACRPTVAAERR